MGFFLSLIEISVWMSVAIGTKENRLAKVALQSLVENAKEQRVLLSLVLLSVSSMGWTKCLALMGLTTTVTDL